MSDHERMFRHEHAHKLDDPERQQWLPPADLMARLELAPGLRVADVGAGTGYFALPIARAVTPGGRVFAVDVQYEMLEHLRAKLDTEPVSLVHGEATRTTLDDDSVDLVFLANVWHEVDDLPAALVEIARILRPAGRLAILDWRTDVEQPPGPPLEHRIPEGDVVALLREHGFVARAPEHVGRFSYLVTARRSS